MDGYTVGATEKWQPFNNNKPNRKKTSSKRKRKIRFHFLFAVAKEPVEGKLFRSCHRRRCRLTIRSKKGIRWLFLSPARFLSLYLSLFPACSTLVRGKFHASQKESRTEPWVGSKGPIPPSKNPKHKRATAPSAPARAVLCFTQYCRFKCTILNGIPRIR